MIGTIKNFLQKTRSIAVEKSAVEAYDIWSGSYDAQPGNLMLDLDEILFSDLLSKVEIAGKQVTDIGCGTGRHWQKLYERSPAGLTGYDVSTGMLKQLRIKYPQAITKQITDDLLKDVATGSVDCIISTLTIAHIKNIDKAIASWSRLLKNGGDLLITDFHPATLAQGGKRSFKHDNRSFSVVNYVHPLDEVIKVFVNHGFYLVRKEEKFITDELRPYYENQQAIAVFDRYKGMPIIFGLHLKKPYAAE